MRTRRRINLRIFGGCADAGRMAAAEWLCVSPVIAAVAVVGLLGGCAAGEGGNAAGIAAEGLPLSSGWELQDSTNLSETGEAISQATYVPKGWHRATVPGTVLTSLVNDGVYPEPLYGENNRKIPESLARASYWYRAQFTTPRGWAGRHIWLNFEGINYMAEIWVNGNHAGSIKGAFARGVFEVSAFVRAGTPASVAVLIEPTLHPGNPQEQTVAKGAGRNGGDLLQDGPTFGASVGWDWIPAIRDRNIGIWQKVTLSASGPVVIRDPLVTSDLPLPRMDSADLTIETTLQNVSDQRQRGVLRGTFGGATFSVPVTLPPATNVVIRMTPSDTPQLHVAHPRLWWPNGYGDPNLYTLHLDFEVKGQMSDRREVTFGIRKIRVQRSGFEISDPVHQRGAGVLPGWELGHG